MQLKRADCSFLILPLELCSGKCKSSFLLLLSSSEMSLSTHTVYTLQSVPRSQIQAWIQTSGLAKFFIFIAYSPRMCLCFHSDASVQKKFSAKEFQEHVLNTPLNRAMWRTNPWENLSAYHYPSVWCAQGWPQAGLYFPLEVRWAPLHPELPPACWDEKELFRLHVTAVPPSFGPATQRQKEPFWLFYCKRWVLLSGLALMASLCWDQHWTGCTLICMWGRTCAGRPGQGASGPQADSHTGSWLINLATTSFTIL